MIIYILFGMTGFDALVLALSTCSTGGFSNYNSSFGPYIGPLEYVASVFMILASIPFIRMVQLIRGSADPLWRDVQVRAYLRWTFYAVAVIVHLSAALAQGRGPRGMSCARRSSTSSRPFRAPAMPRPT
jgi:trk system potassium uptake protein TrkH